MVQRLRAIVRSTPGRLTATLIVLLLLGIAYGITAFTGSNEANADVSSVQDSSGPLTVSAQSLYRALSDADATAATAFLSPGAETAASRQRYETDIAAAGTALAQVTAGASGTSAISARRLDVLATELPVYTGLVETARTNNRLGYPVGAAYLREASGLMRATLLPAAQDVYSTQTQRLRSDHNAGARISVHRCAARCRRAGCTWLRPALPDSAHASTRQPRARRGHTRAAGRTDLSERRLVRSALAPEFGAGRRFQPGPGARHGTHRCATGAGGRSPHSRCPRFRRRLRAGLSENHGRPRRCERQRRPARPRRVNGDRSGGTGGDPQRVEQRRGVAEGAHGVCAPTTTAATIRPPSPRPPARHPMRSPTSDEYLAAGIAASDATFTKQAAAAGRTIHVVGIVVVILTLLALGGAAIGVQRRIAEYR